MGKLGFTIGLLSLSFAIMALPPEQRENLTEEERQARMEKRFSRLTERLSLTEQQQVEVRAIFDQAKESRDSARQESREAMKAHRESVKQQLSGVLSEDQMAEMDAFRKERKQRKMQK
jgi:membrane-associated HD superfamily phosphohydrolase